jgi:hypothetical protein
MRFHGLPCLHVDQEELGLTVQARSLVQVPVEELQALGEGRRVVRESFHYFVGIMLRSALLLLLLLLWGVRFLFLWFWFCF